MNNPLKIICSLFLFIPIASYAHLISITPTRDFPATIPASSSSTASFTVKNITSHTTVNIVNESQFPTNGPLSVSASTCTSPLTPGATCTIDLQLIANSPGTKIKSTLKLRAEPSIDVVQYPIRVTITSGLPQITLSPMDSSALPALRDPIVAEYNNQWLIMGGSMGTIHDFSYASTNKNIYVYNPNTQAIYSTGITTLPDDVKAQLTSVDALFIQDGDKLYIIGGYYNPSNSATDFITLQTITSIDVPNMMNAIINDLDFTSYVHYRSDTPQFQVTGGQLGKIEDDFYLAYGMACTGFYDDNTGSCSTSLDYTYSIYQFSLDDPTLASPITIINTVTHTTPLELGWRRRDYTLAPLLLGNTQTLLAMGGPFTPDVFAWTNDILISADIVFNNNFHTQQANQYAAAFLSIYSENTASSYLATFGSITTLYWGETGLVYNAFLPFGNVLDLLSVDASGNVQEYANTTPLCSGQTLANCLYMGVGAHFLHVSNSSYYDSRGILQLDALPNNTATLVGYVYGGLVSPVREPFSQDPIAGESTNQVYGVYVKPAGTAGNQWLNITDINP